MGSVPRLLCFTGVSVLVWWLPTLSETRLFQTVKTYSEMIGFSCLATTGAVISVSAGMPWFWIPVCAALTCAGGGMLRDIVINREPLTFRGVVYEEVAIIGGLVRAAGLYLANSYEHSAEPVWISVGGSILVIFVIKLLVHHYNWRYPTRDAIQDTRDTVR
jgi:NitT/TauT family transport system substrate-binding protein